MLFACETSGQYSLEYGVLSIEPAFAEWLLDRIDQAEELGRSHDDLYGLCFFNYNVTYYGSLPDEVLEEVEGCGDWIEINAEQLEGCEQERIEAPTMYVTDDLVVWRAHPKYGSGEVETPCLTRQQIEPLTKATTTKI